jgi:hypothetical protein
MKTVHDLRKNGWKVKVGHYRLLYKFHPKTGVKTKKIVLISEWFKNPYDYSDLYLSPTGGVTKLHITSPDGQVDLYTSAICAQDEYYNKKTGVKIALGRALKEINKPDVSV